MRALFGVILELAALAAVAYVASIFAGLYPLSILVLLAAQALTTVLVHCPSHYFVGRALGIKFRGMGFGRSTASRALQGPLKRVSSLLFVPTLRVDPESRKTAPPGRMRLMFLAGVSGSVASAVVFASAVSLSGYYAIGLANWVFALVYLASDVAFSPKAGDLMRARALAVKR